MVPLSLFSSAACETSASFCVYHNYCIYDVVPAALCPSDCLRVAHLFVCLYTPSSTLTFLIQTWPYQQSFLRTQKLLLLYNQKSCFS